VLEIGCSAGGNLIPFAAWHPEARAVGIDLSQVQIEQGRRRVAALGLRNVELFPADIAQIDPAALGMFDFVVCHGVYSRVPEHVQQAIVSALRAALAPDGIGYLSYTCIRAGRPKRSSATRCCCAAAP
jgi:cyclopropane fatty-acyl-phospholipid synthase-like methyltransferase